MRPGRLALLIAGWLLAATANADINEGDLRLLADRPDPPPHLHSKQIRIIPESLDDGWVRDRQCHARLDPVAALDIVFGEGKVRHLHITHAENIGEARVTQHAVELRNIGQNAVLCLESELRLLERDSLSGHYLLVSGPYMRRFLDGYFPLQLVLDIDYPADRLRILELQPQALQPHSRLLPGRVRIEVLFEGRLEIAIRFEPLPAR
jgi:hypothetical protein